MIRNTMNRWMVILIRVWHRQVLVQMKTMDILEKMMSEVDAIMAFESGELDDDGIIDLFQKLIDSGLAWKLQGSYGRTATALINAGYCTRG
jgi:hypothetical protein